MSIDVFSSHMNAETVRLDPKRAAIVAIDMINEFCKPGGKMVLPGYEALVPPQLTVIEAARRRGRRSFGSMTAIGEICGGIANG